MKLQLVKNTTSKRVAIFIQDSSSTTGAGRTGLLFNSAGLTWYYWREDAGNVGGTQVTLVTATRGTYTSGGFIQKDATNMPGFYEIGIPDAALASGAGWVVMVLRGAADMVPVTLEIQLTDVDLHNGTTGGISDIASISTATVGSISQIASATDIPATPTLKQAAMLLYMYVRNAGQATAAERRVMNDAGTEVLDAPMSDNGTTFDQGKLGNPT